MTDNTWPYTLERGHGGWHWSLSYSDESLSSWTGWSFTKRGATRAMKKIKRDDARRIKSKEVGRL